MRPEVQAGRRRGKHGSLLAAAVTGLRYEGLFLTGVAFLLFGIRRRWAPAGAVLLGGAIPPVSYGLVSISHGWLFLPNSMIFKAHTDALRPGVSLVARLTSQWEWALGNVRKGPYLLAAIAMLVLLAFLLRRLRHEHATAGAAVSWYVVVLLPVALLQTVVASVGYFYRYDAYVVGLSIATLALACPLLLRAFRRDGARRPAVLTSAMAVFMLALLVPRGYRAVADTVTATGNIFQQQMQMAAFLSDHYKGAVVVANDVGVIDYYADIRLFDFTGLADIEAARFRLSWRYNEARRVMEELANRRHAVFGMVYRSWLEKYGAVPDSWRVLGTWTIDNNVVCADDVVTFFGIDPAADDALVAALRDYSTRLPKGVHAVIAGAVQGP